MSQITALRLKLIKANSHIQVFWQKHTYFKKLLKSSRYYNRKSDTNCKEITLSNSAYRL